MGYQESYVTTKSKKDFPGLCEYIKTIGKDFYKAYGTMPVEIITLDNGRQYIYFVGERYLQRSKARLLGYVLGDNDYNSESQKMAMWQWLEKIVVIFTEEMCPDGIWEDAGQPVAAIHEKFEM